MARHFFGLYLLIVLTLATVSCGQDKLLQAYGVRDAVDDQALTAALYAVANQLHGIPLDEWKRSVADISGATKGIVRTVLDGGYRGRQDSRRAQRRQGLPTCRQQRARTGR